MINPSLAQLRDIHLPPAIGWWPLAIGWQFVLVLTFLAVVAAGYACYRWYFHPSYKRLALQLLNDYEKKYQQHKNASKTGAEVSELLRRVALVYFPRQDVATLHGQAWLDFLSNNTELNFNQLKPSLIEITYQPIAYDFDIKPLLTLARAWIKSRSKPCLN